MCCIFCLVRVSVDESSSNWWSSLHTGSLGASVGFSIEASVILTSSRHFAVQPLISTSNYVSNIVYLIGTHFLAGSQHA